MKLLNDIFSKRDKISKMHDAILFAAIFNNSYMYLSFPGYRFVENAISWFNLFSIISHRLEQVVKHSISVYNLLYQIILRHKYLLSIQYA